MSWYRAVQPPAGSVVLDVDDSAWQRCDDEWCRAWDDTALTWQALVGAHGPVRVIHRGEHDEEAP